MKMMGMIALCAMVLVACGDPGTIEDIRDEAREQGYAQGKQAAYTETQQATYDAGYWDGYDDGFTDAQQLTQRNAKH